MKKLIIGISLLLLSLLSIAQEFPNGMDTTKVKALCSLSQVDNTLQFKREELRGVETTFDGVFFVDLLRVTPHYDKPPKHPSTFKKYLWPDKKPFTYKVFIWKCEEIK